MDLKVWLQRSPLIAILRGVQPEEVESIGAALQEEGISIVEVPLNSPQPLESIARLARRFGGEMLVGAGTLTEPSQAAQVAAAGGRIAVTPHADTAVVSAAKAAGLIAVPGFFNPTEAFSLLRAGADAIKLFPADVLGPGMLKAMRAVLPKEAMVIPVGGIGAAQIAAWHDAGANGFGIGTAIYKPGDDAQAVGAKARALMDAVRAADSSLG
ncbi:MAG TPA: 2-dehydro-3-deoxy-6-phosphogalactonate aldolase [Edaphobacter sp.]|nr:2-dehydro-3-deoxy-6-phosphogalactonate aldolase [Edaphobacter sp.]